MAAKKCPGASGSAVQTNFDNANSRAGSSQPELIAEVASGTGNRSVLNEHGDLCDDVLSGTLQLLLTESQKSPNF
jgi:hypothetical protein